MCCCWLVLWPLSHVGGMFLWGSIPFCCWAAPTELWQGTLLLSQCWPHTNHSVQNPSLWGDRNLCVESLQNLWFACSFVSYPSIGSLNQWSRNKCISYFLSLIFSLFVCLLLFVFVSILLVGWIFSSLDFRNTDPETESKPGPFWVEARSSNPCPCCPFNSRWESSLCVCFLCSSAAQQAILMMVVCYQLYFKHFLFLYHNNSAVYELTLKCLLYLTFLYHGKKI